MSNMRMEVALAWNAWAFSIWKQSHSLGISSIFYYNKTAAENKTAVDISTAVGEH